MISSIERVLQHTAPARAKFCCVATVRAVCCLNLEAILIIFTLVTNPSRTLAELQLGNV